MRRLIVKFINKQAIMELQTIGNIIYKSAFTDSVCIDVEEKNIEKIKGIAGIANVREEREGELLSCSID